MVDKKNLNSICKDCEEYKRNLCYGIDKKGKCC